MPTRSLPPSAPVLRTARLVLSAHGLGDFEDCAALWADPEVVRYISGKPSTREEVWMRLLRYVGHWAAMGYGFWAIREAESGRFVGEIGFANFHRELEPSFGEAPEMGWALRPWAHGRGMASEALGAVIAWGETKFGPSRTVCMIDPLNTRSVTLAERHGFRVFAVTEYRESDVLLLERPAPSAAGSFKSTRNLES